MSTQPTITFNRFRDTPRIYEASASGTAVEAGVVYDCDVYADGDVVLWRDDRKIRAAHKLALRAVILAAYRHTTRGVDTGEQHDAHMGSRATSAALDLVTFDPAPIARPTTLPTMLRAAYAFHRRQCWGLFNGWPCRASEALAQARIDVERGIFRALPQAAASCAR